MIFLKDPLKVTLEFGPNKVEGFVMQLTSIGIMVELEKIPFKVGAVLTATILINDKTNIVEKVRSMKHYDKFFRQKPKKLKEGETPPVPKMLCELHYQLLTEQSRVVISKFLLRPKTGK